MIIFDSNYIASAVSIISETGSTNGSGFLLNNRKAIYLITAKHVLTREDGKFRDEEININCIPTSEISSIIFQIKFEDAIIQKGKGIDVIIIQIGIINNYDSNTGKSNYTLVKGIEWVDKGNCPIIAINIEDIFHLEDLNIGNEIFVLGYPKSLGLKQSPQFDYNKPLLKKGIISNFFQEYGNIIMDCSVYPGNSGGPVFSSPINNQSSTYNLIGMVSQSIPFIQKWTNIRDNITHEEYHNSGYSVAISIDKIIGVITILESTLSN